MSFKDMLTSFFATNRYNAENSLYDAQYVYNAVAAVTEPEHMIYLTAAAEIVHDYENQCIEATGEYARQLAYSGEIDCVSTEGYIMAGDAIIPV
jgi:hypothetical protein